MVKYRLRFKIQKESEVELNRDNNINSILSEIENVVSNDPIRKPLKDEVILVNGEEYRVNDVLISFEKEGDITYYDFIVSLVTKSKPKKKDEPLTKKDIEDIFTKYTKKKDLSEHYKKIIYGDWNDKFEF